MIAQAGHMRQIVDEAFAAIGGIAGDEDSELRRIAFERVLDTLLRDDAASSNGAASVAAASQEKIDDTFATEAQRAEAISRYLKITPDAARDLFDVSGDEPGLLVNSRKLASAKSPATKQIVLLVSAARDALGLRTGTADIRQAADDLGKYDKNNFTRTMQEIDEVALRGKSGSPNREIRLRLVGTEAARSLAQELASQ